MTHEEFVAVLQGAVLNVLEQGRGQANVQDRADFFEGALSGLLMVLTTELLTLGAEVPGGENSVPNPQNPLRSKASEWQQHPTRADYLTVLRPTVDSND